MAYSDDVSFLNDVISSFFKSKYMFLSFADDINRYGNLYYKDTIT